MKKNYNKIMKQQIEEIKLTDDKEKILLHACCAPCSSGVIEKLADFFEVVVYFYNPNIYPYEEYIARKNDLQNFLKAKAIEYIDVDDTYEYEGFKAIYEGLENLREGDTRCFKCFFERLNMVALKAKELNIKYFTTTLTISPHKNATVINKIGVIAAKKNDVIFLHSDFKKEEGYKKSIELSKEYDLYRQDYCGCEYSLRDSTERKETLNEV